MSDILRGHFFVTLYLLGFSTTLFKDITKRDEIAGITGIRKFYLIPLYATSFIHDKSWVDFAFPDHIVKEEVFINNKEKRTAMMSKKFSLRVTR